MKYTSLFLVLLLGCGESDSSRCKRAKGEMILSHFITIPQVTYIDKTPITTYNMIPVYRCTVPLAAPLP